MPNPIKINANIHYPAPTNPIEVFHNPNYIYIPLKSKNNIKYTKIVKVGDYIYKNMPVAIDKQTNFQIHSSISGLFVREQIKTISNGNKVKCIVIKNDFKDKTKITSGYKNKLSNYTKEEFILLLQQSGISGMSGSDFPTYRKYQINNPKCLIINGVECEPYLSCDKTIIYYHIEEILETIDAISHIMNIKTCYLAVSQNDKISINTIQKYIETYPHIGLKPIKQGYPNGWEKYIITSISHQTYLKYPTEIGIIINNVSTIYAIYQLLKYHQPLTERIITITGTKISSPINIQAKIGTNIKEILSKISTYSKTKDKFIIAGGPMTGIAQTNDDIIVTRDLNGIIINDSYQPQKTTPCIKCGKCSEVCPVNLIPNAIMQNKLNSQALSYLKPNRCIECGLCSYICPANINLREQVRQAKQYINKEGRHHD